MLTPDTAYLLGMIAGKGEIKRERKETKIIIEIPHRNLKIEGENTQQSVKESLLDIMGRLKSLIGANNLDWDTSKKNIAYITFSKLNEDYFISSINHFFKNKISRKDFRIPEEIFNSSTDIKKEFLRGFSDVTGHIRRSNVAFVKKGKDTYSARAYIEIPTNWGLVVDTANLLKSLDVPIQNIDWAHPNFRDPDLKDYNKGKKANFREHQIKIYADEFEKIGFSIEHKNRLLKKYAELNRMMWDKRWEKRAIEAKTEATKKKALEKVGHLEISHHRFYWKTRESKRIKPSHPLENHESIPERIRGKHFDNWKDLAKELGYHE